MKIPVAPLFILLIAAVFSGCYKQVPEEAMVPADVKVVSLDEPVPKQDEADVVIITDIRKASYLLSQRTAGTPYTFVISIDGRELKEDLKGVKDAASISVGEKKM